STEQLPQPGNVQFALQVGPSAMLGSHCSPGSSTWLPHSGCCPQVGGRVVDVVLGAVTVVGVTVVVVVGSGTQVHCSVHSSVALQPAPESQASPPPASTTPSPQRERVAVNAPLNFFALSLPVMVLQVAASIFAASFTLPVSP